MSQILRAVRTEITQIRQFRTGQRNTGSHYETLRIPRDASQRDVRLAFIKLSKEMHPDTSKKISHTEFVKICDAYKVLSKEHTRRRYDSNLRSEQGARGRSFRVVYYENEYDRFAARNWHRSPDEPYSEHGPRGGKHTRNVTVAMLCLLVSAFGLAAQMILVSRALTFDREHSMAESEKHAAAYKKVCDEASGLDRKQQIAAYERRRIAAKRPSEYGVDFVER